MKSSTPFNVQTLQRTGQWVTVSMLAFGVFVVGTGEFVLAGLLPLLSQSLHISASTAGQVITVFALTCAIAGPVLTTFTSRWQRRPVLVIAILIYLAGSVWTALAPHYWHVVAGQILAALGVGLFVPNATVTAAALVPEAHRGKAIAVVVSGFTAAASLGAPFGTLLGGLFGWRTTLWLAAALAVVGALGVLALVPKRTSTSQSSGIRQQICLLGEPRILAVLGVTLLAFTAVYIPYTYIGVIFEPATGESSFRLAGLMLTLGIVGTLGNLAAGFFADRIGGPKVVAIALTWLMVSLVALPHFTTNLLSAFAVVAFFAVAAFAITTPQQHRLIALKPQSAAVLISLNQAVLYLAIALSGLVGGLGVDWIGANHVSYIAAALAAASLLLSQLAKRIIRS
jgi:DHA1 family inner membrane transport protein